MASLYQPRIANAPDYRIAIGGDIITPKIRPRLVSLRLTVSRGHQADQLTLVLDDTDGQMAVPKTGVVVSVSLGWQNTGLVERGQYTIDEVEVSGTPDQIHIRGRSANLRESLPEKHTKSWHATTIGTIIDTIASRHSLTPVIAAKLAPIVIAHIDQTDESDINFITRLGHRYDAIAAIKSGRLLFTPTGKATTVSGQSMPAETLTRKDIERHSYRRADRNAYTGVIAYWRDTNAARRKSVTAGDRTRPKTLRETYTNATEAQHAAQAEYQRLQRGKQSLSLDLVRGRERLAPETAIRVNGIKREIDAVPWVATQVHDALTPTAYKSTLDLEVQGESDTQSAAAEI